MFGEFEVDECFIGGLAQNMHKNKKAKITGVGGAEKAIVTGILDRRIKKIRLRHAQNTQRETLQGVVREYVAKADELSLFERLKWFARVILAVPKAEIAEKEAEYRSEKHQRQKKPIAQKP